MTEPDAHGDERSGDTEDAGGALEVQLLRWDAAIRRSGAKAQRVEASRERVEAARNRADAARERAEAARQRADGLLEKFVLPDGGRGRDTEVEDDPLRVANRREADADERERIADERERQADERERIADEREAQADERELIADRRQAEVGAGEGRRAGALPTASERGAVSRALEEQGEKLRLKAAQISERMADEAETFADYLENSAARGDQALRMKIAETEREIAKVGRRNAARLREPGAAHHELEHIPEFPHRQAVAGDPPAASPAGGD